MRIKSTLILLSGLILGLGTSQYCRAEQDDGNRKFQVETKENKEAKETPDQIRERKNMDEQERQRQFQIQQATLQAKAEADRLERDREKIQEERRQREAILAEREANEKKRLLEVEARKAEEEAKRLEKIQAEIKKKADSIMERKDQIVALKHEEQKLIDAQADAKRKVTLYTNKIDGLKKNVADYQREYNDWRIKNNSANAPGVSVRNDTTEQMGRVQRKLDTANGELERNTKGLAEANKDLSEANAKVEQNRSAQAAYKKDQQALKKAIEDLGGTFDIPDDSITAKTIKPAKVEEPAVEKSVKLKDGTVLKAAKIMDFGDTYAVKGTDGKVTNVKKDDVDEIK